MSAVPDITPLGALYDLQMLFACAAIFFPLFLGPRSAFRNQVESALLEGLLRARMKVLLRFS